MQYLKHCLNPKVIAAVVVAVGIWVFAPGAFAAALPTLVLAICPLSMLVMVLLMRDSGREADPNSPPAQAQDSSDDAEDHAIAALRAQVAELEARLAAATRPAEASDQPAEPAPAARDADR